MSSITAIRSNQARFNDVADFFELGHFPCGTTSGTSTAYTASSTLIFENYNDGQLFTFIAHAASGNDPTININTKGAISLYDRFGNQIKSGDLTASTQYIARVSNSGTRLVVLNNLMAWRTFTPSGVSGSGSMTVSAINYVYMQYKRNGDLGYLRGHFDCTLGGTASSSVILSGLPFNMAQEAGSPPRSGVFRCILINSGLPSTNNVHLGTCWPSSATSLSFASLLDSSASYTLGTSKRFSFEGSHKAV